MGKNGKSLQRWAKKHTTASEEELEKALWKTARDEDPIRVDTILGQHLLKLLCEEINKKSLRIHPTEIFNTRGKTRKWNNG